MKKIQQWKKFLLIVVFLIIVVLIINGFFNEFEVNHYTIEDSRLPVAFEGFTIVHISDLEGMTIGDHQETLVEAIKEADPDLIVFTGDMIYKKSKNLKNIEDLLSGIKDIAPIYSANGNHEISNSLLYEELVSMYSRYSVREINNQSIQIVKGSDVISLCGIDYPTSQNEYDSNRLLTEFDSENYRILLCHDSNKYEYIQRYGFNLVLAGHTHGGIIRLPLVGGVLGNNGKLFPKYDSGVFERNGGYLISSRGLGDSIVPRFYNNPELVVIHLIRGY